MSLLMDALKRAERARQAEAGQNADDEREESSGPARTQGLSLDPMIDNRSGRTAGDGDFPSLEVGPAGDSSTDLLRGFDDSDPFDRNDDRPSRSPLDLEPITSADVAEASGEFSLADGSLDPPRSTAGPLSLADDEPMSIDDTSATLPSIKAARASVEDYFDGTRSISMSMDSIQDAVDGSDTVTGERSPPDTASQETARAVFDAKAPRRRRSSAAVVVLVPLMLALMLGAGGWYYWDAIYDLFIGQPSVVAGRVRSTPPAPVPSAVAAVSPAPAEPSPSAVPAPGSAAPAMPAPAVASAPSVRNAVSAAPGPAAATAQGTAAGASDGAVLATAAAPQEMVSGNFTAAPTVDEVIAAPEAAVPFPGQLPAGTSVEEHLKARLADSGLAGERSAAGPAGIRILRSRSAARVNPGLRDAYQAYGNGDLPAAEAHYQRVLGQEPRNRDALLGVAAVSMRAGDWKRANAIYLDLLGNNPRDEVALTGVIALNDNVDPVAGESRIKSMLATQPDAAFLHFNLGNLYARQLRWPEAEDSYFTAFRLDQDNADYAYNLAVSLDQLVQRRAAVGYYERALELADAGGATGFAADAVRRRIEAIGR